MTNCPFCNQLLKEVWHYQQKPESETAFNFSQESYSRSILQCQLCKHFVSNHEMDTSQLYSGDYVESTYGDIEGIQRIFQRVINLPPEQSDNRGRVKYIIQFAHQFFSHEHLSLLDVGSGLGVFPYQINQDTPWQCTGLDPDPQSIQHMQEVLNINAIHANFLELTDIIKETYHLLTFNKVLEHVKEPIDMLSQSHQYLKPKGLVYIELPDGEMAARESFEREEFFIDHFHVFSASSFSLLASRSNFQIEQLERLKEPSGKYTLRAFLTPLHSA